MILFLKKYVRKFHYAFTGLCHGVCKDASILLQCGIGFIVICVCFFLSLHIWEWIVILFSIGMVISLEFMNSAIETVVDMISPEYNEYAKKAKDYAAAAVLIMSCIAALAGILIIGGKFL